MWLDNLYVTFGRLVGLGRIGIESSGHPRYFPLLLNLGIIAHFLLEILELSGNGSASPWPVELHIGLETSVCVTQLDSVSWTSVAHVEDINKNNQSTKEG